MTNRSLLRHREAWTVEISLDLDSETSNLLFEKEFVASAMVAATVWHMEETVEARWKVDGGRSSTN